jgi:hypothetical protein
MEPIVNKVAESGIISLDLETFFSKDPIMVFDLKDYLFMGLILKEKDFRAALLTTDWEKYKESYVAVTCSADAIIPMWANMLVAVYLTPIVKGVYFGTESYVKEQLLLKALDTIKAADFYRSKSSCKGMRRRSCSCISICENHYVSKTLRQKYYVWGTLQHRPPV